MQLSIIINLSFCYSVLDAQSLFVIRSDCGNPEVYSKKKLEFSIETFRHGNHLVILRERSCQQLKYLFFFIFIILVKNWSGFPIKDFGNDISVVIQSESGNPGLKESGSPIKLGMTVGVVFGDDSGGSFRG